VCIGKRRSPCITLGLPGPPGWDPDAPVLPPDLAYRPTLPQAPAARNALLAGTRPAARNALADRNT
jgi:hypothetical protein